MQSPREIRRRIKSISSTAQITRAMQMVAASKMKKIQEATVAMRPLVRVMYRIQRAATAHLGEFTHPLLQVREVRKRAVILIGTDRGLCGPLNSNLFRLAAEFDPESTVFITAGRKAAQFVARSQRKLIAEFTYSDTPRYPEARAIASLCLRSLLERGGGPGPRRCDAVHQHIDPGSNMSRVSSGGRNQRDASSRDGTQRREGRRGGT